MKKFTKILVIALCLVAVFALAGCAAKTTVEPKGTGTETAATDKSLSAITDKGTLVVGMAPFYAPFESTNESTKEIEGFDVDLINAIAEKMGVKVELKGAEWNALLGGITKGDFDVIFSAMSKKEAAEANVEFSTPYYILPDVIIAAEGNPLGIQSKTDLKDRVVGVQLGSGAEQVADAAKDEVGIKEVKKYKLTQDAMNDLKAGRIDAVVAGQAFAIEQGKVDKSFAVGNTPLSSDELVGVFKKDSAALVEAFNKALAEVKADGTYDELVEKWLTVK